MNYSSIEHSKTCRISQWLQFFPLCRICPRPDLRYYALVNPAPGETANPPPQGLRLAPLIFYLCSMSRAPCVSSLD